MIIKANDWCRPDFNLDNQIENKVAEILLDIQKRGSDAIEQYSQQFDQKPPKLIQLKPFQDYSLNAALADSIKFAAERIESFAKFQKQATQSRSFRDEFGDFSQVVLPIEKVGAYIPAGRYPLISTALMTLIPAKVAGSPTRIACSPSDHPAILAAASLAGATQFLHIGGVQAIASLAFGYQMIDPVDVIVGPGNAWVNEAKKQIQSRVKIDGLAGPSELLMICDNNQPIEWLALDALAQAEHDPLACSLVVSDHPDWLTQMLVFLKENKQTRSLLVRKQIELIRVASPEQAVSFSNDYAPEHLMLCHDLIDEGSLLNYGSLFVGANSAVALGDYIAGPNHTLPTLGYARQNGGLNVQTFLRVLTRQVLNHNGRQQLSKKAMPMAKAEGLTYHYESLKIRSI